MRKILPFMLFLSLAAMWLIACGSSSKQVQPPPQGQATTFAFMQEAPMLFSPMVGQFTTTNGNTTFSSSAVIDSTNNQPVEADFESVSLSTNGKKATLDLWGGLEADSDVTQIVVANADGSGPVQITHDTYWNEMPQFSPDGTKVIFNSDRMAPDQSWYENVVVRNADGTGSETVLPLYTSGFDGFWAPTYSPNGSKIAVEAWGTDSTTNIDFDGILVMNADGSNKQMLTNPQAAGICNCYIYDEHPAFTNDGSKITFSRYAYDYSSQTESEDIFIINADGSAVTQLTSGAGFNFDTISLNIAGVGERILFSSNRANPSSSGAFDLYSMKLDGTGVIQQTKNPLYDSFSAFWYGSGSANAAARMARHSGVTPQQRHPQYHVHGNKVHF